MLVIRLGNEGEIVADGGGTILVHSEQMSPERRAELLRGPGVGLREHLDGKLVLHGSCVAWGDRALAIVGPSGAGKSSLSVALCQHGATLVSDGMTIVDPRTLRVDFLGPTWRLKNDSLRALGYDPNHYDVDDSFGVKRRLEQRRENATADTLLTDVLLIAQGMDLSLRELPGTQQIMGLIGNAYLASALPESESIVLFSRCSEAIASGLVVRRLVRPREWRHMAAVVAMVEQARFREGRSKEDS